MAKADRTIVGSPLTVGLLADLGAVADQWTSFGPFDPQASWTHRYRIWTCHGYRETGNQDVGFLRIRRDSSSGEGTFQLRVEQVVVETDALLSRIEAEILCRDDERASPLKWRLSSRFFGPDGEELGDLALAEAVSVQADTLVVETPGPARRRQVPVPVTSDWSLFEAIQRLDVGAGRKWEVNLLEGLSVLKPDQEISYRGLSQEKLGDQTVSLHCFQQLGQGALPTEYWLDRDRRLLAVVSMNKAYILDDQAEDAIERRQRAVQESYRKAQMRRRQPGQ
ncbi:MAG: hypothetical protein JW741_06760 [Sedimentisphaerales bacterium]|nr:hypothetical protein [Sedimentisphaerales bacterium]